MPFQTSTSKYNDNRKDCPRCDHCGKEGHLKDSYWDIVGYPPNWRKQNRKKKERTNNWDAEKGASKAAQVSKETSPISRMSLQQYERLLEQIQDDTDQRVGVQHNKYLLNMAGKLISHKPWIIDSGPSDHITCHHNLMKRCVSSLLKPCIGPQRHQRTCQWYRESLFPE